MNLFPLARGEHVEEDLVSFFFLHTDQVTTINTYIRPHQCERLIHTLEMSRLSLNKVNDLPTTNLL